MKSYRKTAKAAAQSTPAHQRAEIGQYQIRMPVQLHTDLVKAAAKNGRRFSKDVRDRLAKSLFEDQWRRDNGELETFLGQIRELAQRVSRYYGAEWHADASAYAAFVETVTRLIAARPAPKGKLSQSAHAPAVVGEIIFQQYATDFLRKSKEVPND
jgi:hypothetical protein